MISWMAWIFLAIMILASLTAVLAHSYQKRAVSFWILGIVLAGVWVGEGEVQLAILCGFLTTVSTLVNFVFSRQFQDLDSSNQIKRNKVNLSVLASSLTLISILVVLSFFVEFGVTSPGVTTSPIELPEHFALVLVTIGLTAMIAIIGVGLLARPGKFKL